MEAFLFGSLKCLLCENLENLDKTEIDFLESFKGSLSEVLLKRAEEGGVCGCSFGKCFEAFYSILLWPVN